jgi:hypothetical protein
MKSSIKNTAKRHPEPSPAAIIGGILALGVTRVLARAIRERGQASQFSPPGRISHSGNLPSSVGSSPLQQDEARRASQLANG